MPVRRQRGSAALPALILISILILIPAALAAAETPTPALGSLTTAFPWLGKVITWLAYIKLASTFFEVRLQHWIADELNEAAATSDLEDDEFLRRLFSERGYRVTAFVFRLVGIRLPTLADLERAIQHQREAAIAAGGNLRNP